MPEIEAEMPNNAVRLYNEGNSTDDFPVLKAFQQYIDAEQAKARKRLITMAIFFSVLMFVVIGVFLALLIGSSERNQRLNDRLVEFVMKEHENRQSAVVVQPSAPVDNTAVLKLTEKLEEMQQKLIESRQQTEAAQKAASEALAKASESAQKGLTPEELEIRRLKSLLADERQKAEDAKKRAREEELEAYRRKHYPEFYAPKPTKKVMRPLPSDDEDDDLDDIDAEIQAVNSTEVSESTAISYFDDDDSADYEEVKDSTKKRKQAKPSSSKKVEKPFSIPVDKKGTRRKWHIPE